MGFAVRNQGQQKEPRSRNHRREFSQTHPEVTDGSFPVDPCGFMTDAARVCGVYDAKPYRDGDGLRQVRFYRVPNGTPILPFPHVYTHPNWLLHNDDAPPGPGTAGVMPGQVAYDKGIRPVLWGNDGFPCGDKRIWLEGGSIAGGDVGLT